MSDDILTVVVAASGLFSGDERLYKATLEALPEDVRAAVCLIDATDKKTLPGVGYAWEERSYVVNLSWVKRWTS